MPGAEAATSVAVEILVKQDQVPEMRVGLKYRVVAENRSLALLIAQEQPDQPPAQMVSHLLQRQLLAGADRALDLEVRSIVTVEAPQAVDKEEVHRHPNRPAPV